MSSAVEMRVGCKSKRRQNRCDQTPSTKAALLQFRVYSPAATRSLLTARFGFPRACCVVWHAFIPLNFSRVSLCKADSHFTTEHEERA